MALQVRHLPHSIQSTLRSYPFTPYYQIYVGNVVSYIHIRHFYYILSHTLPPFSPCYCTPHPPLSQPNSPPTTFTSTTPTSPLPSLPPHPHLTSQTSSVARVNSPQGVSPAAAIPPPPPNNPNTQSSPYTPYTPNLPWI